MGKGKDAKGKGKKGKGGKGKGKEIELNEHERKARDIYREIAQREVPHHDPAKGKTRICFFHLLQMDGPCSKKHACDKSHSTTIQLTKEEKDACRLYLTKLNQAGFGPRSASRAPSQPVTAEERERRKKTFCSFYAAGRCDRGADCGWSHDEAHRR